MLSGRAALTWFGSPHSVARLRRRRFGTCLSRSEHHVYQRAAIPARAMLLAHGNSHAIFCMPSALHCMRRCIRLLCRLDEYA